MGPLPPETGISRHFVEDSLLGNHLRGFWYLAMRGDRLRPGATAPFTLLGEALLIGRRSDNRVFAFRDRCPHRGMPLRHAALEGDALRCCFHGWRFETEAGRCVEIPALAPGDEVDPGRFGLAAYDCREFQGNIWVFMPPEERDGAAKPRPAIPAVPGFGDRPPCVGATMRFPCHSDQAVIGFIDPAHPPFVHVSRWWKAKPAAVRLKEKAYEPTALGFRMTRHRLEGGALPYRVLGANPAVEVTIELPGIRVEHIAGERHAACVLAAATPIDDHTTDVHYCLYWTPRWLAPLKPVARWMTRQFLGQDRDVAVKLGDVPAESDATLLVGDPDAQIKWWYRLKQAYERSAAAQAPFINPLRPRTLRWRS